MKRIYLLVLSYLIITVNSYAQVLRGKLVDEKNEPLSEVTIKIKNSGKWTVSNQEGEFELIIDQNCATLTFSGVHIKEKEQLTCISDNVIIRLERLENLLDEVLIMGYTNTTKRYLVGSVTKIDGADIAKQAVGNPLQALHGRVPGMTVTMSSGLPGASVSIQVRGQNALKPDTWGRHYVDQPLFIIDGIPFSPQNDNINQFRSVYSPNSQENAHGGFSPFNTIDPNSIESIEVLKDADATALYGSRGGNGVILITTRRGKLEKTQFNLNLSQGFSLVGNLMPLMNTEDYLKMRREAFENDGLTPSLNPNTTLYSPDLLLFDQNKYTNWQKYFLGNTANKSIANVSIRNGTEHTQFFIGSSLFRETFIYPGNSADYKYNVNSNLRHYFNNKKIAIDFSLVYSNSENNAISSIDMINVLKIAPNYPDPLDANGNLIWNVGDIQFRNFYDYNPLSYQYHPYQIKNSVINLGFNSSFIIKKGLTAKLNIGQNAVKSSEWSAFTRKGSNPFQNYTRKADFGSRDMISLIIEPQISYNTLYNNNDFELLIGGSYEENFSVSKKINSTGHLDDELLKSISAAPNSSASDSHGQYKFLAGFARLNYRWNKQIIANLTFRRDGSSRFGPQKRFGNFGAIGIGWIFKDEKNFNKNSYLSFGKIRASLGWTGSDNTTPYQYISRWAPVGGAYEGSMGYAPLNLFNPEVSWAKTQKSEIGFDLEFKNQLFRISTTYYNNISGNQLVNYRLPTQTGFNSISMNWDAVVQNYGLEIILGSSPMKKNSFEWNIDANLTIPKNKLLRFDNLESSSYSTDYIVGKSLNLLLGFEFAGVNSQTGIFEYYTATGEKVERPEAPRQGKLNDFKYLGTLDPDYYGGINNSIRFNNFHLSFFIEFKSRMGSNFLKYVYGSPVGQVGNLPVIMNDRWQKPGDESRFMKVTTLSGSRDNPTSTLFPRSSGAYGRADYIRWKSAILTWTMPNFKGSKLVNSNISLSISGNNLMTFTNYEGNDPEALSFYAVPPLKSFVFGIQAKF